MYKSIKKYFCKNCENIFFTRSSHPNDVQCMNGTKKACGSRKVFFLSEISFDLTETEKKIIENIEDVKVFRHKKDKKIKFQTKKIYLKNISEETKTEAQEMQQEEPKTENTFFRW